MNERLLSAARIATLAGVSRQIVTRVFNEKCPGAKVGTKWNIYDEYISQYLAERGVDVNSSNLQSATERRDPQATKPVSQRRTKYTEAGHRPSPRQARNTDDIGKVASIKDLPIEDHANLTIMELAAQFGSDEEYRGWLDARKKQIEIIERQIKVDEKTGELIGREFVRKAVFGLIEEFTSRILVDSAVTIATKVFAHRDSGDSIEEATQTVRDEISKPLKAAKSRIVKNLKSEVE